MAKLQLLQHPAGTRREQAERHLEIGNGIFQVGVLIELLAQSAEDSMRFGYMLGGIALLIGILRLVGHRYPLTILTARPTDANFDGPGDG